MDKSVIWQDKLAKAKKVAHKWRESWLIGDKNNEVMNELSSSFEMDWPYQLLLKLLP